MNARSHLREHTQNEHAEIDAIYSRFDLSTLSGYSEFLTAQARAFLPLEAALDTAGAADVIDDWHERRRGLLLLADLSDLGISSPEHLKVAKLDTRAAILGALYVLEGSRLGGAILRRRVPAPSPTRFLSTDDSGRRWRTLIGMLDSQLASNVNLRLAVASAQAAFHYFKTAAQADVQA